MSKFNNLSKIKRYYKDKIIFITCLYGFVGSSTLRILLKSVYTIVFFLHLKKNCKFFNLISVQK